MPGQVARKIRVFGELMHLRKATPEDLENARDSYQISEHLAAVQAQIVETKETLEFLQGREQKILSIKDGKKRKAEVQE